MNTTENTPAHCHGCHGVDECHQAQNMRADTLPVEGWVRDGDVYCGDCLDHPDDYDCSYCGESDSPTHCGGCGVPIIHELTPEGVEYVREALQDGGGCARELWPEVWAEYDVLPKIPVDSIVIPGRFIDLCSEWYDGQGCMLYAVSSTGGLTLGSIRPEGCETEEKWYLTLWRNLSADMYRARRCAGDDQAYPEGHEDIPALCEFDEWVDEQVDQLEESYGLADWDN